MIAGAIALAVLLVVFIVVLFTLLGAPYVKNAPVPIVQSSYVTALGIVTAVLVLALTGLVVLSAVMGA